MKPVRMGSAHNRRELHDQLVASALALIAVTWRDGSVAAWPNKTLAGMTRDGEWIRRQTYRGSGDIMVCVRGRHLELEGKTGSAKLSDAQTAHQARIHKAGGRHIVFRTPEEALEAVRVMLEEETGR